MFDMMVKSICPALKLVAGNAADEADTLLVLLRTELKEQVKYQIICACSIIEMTYPLISKLRESIHYDTKHNVETNGGHNDEEGDIIDKTQSRHTKLLRHKGYNLYISHVRPKLLNDVKVI